MELDLIKKREQNIELLMETLDLIPSISEMQKCSSDEVLKITLDDISSLCFPLLRWVIQSNRAHLAFIPVQNQIKEMKTKYQFTLVSSAPEHEKIFRQHVQDAVRKGCENESGTFKAFHGSPIGNWHSIIRTGLRSGFVRGIYMAQYAATSHGYMQVGTTEVLGWLNSSWGSTKQMSAIGLLEVADHRKNQKKITGGSAQGTINVALDNSLVTARFLFFYPDGPKFSMGQNYFGGGGGGGGKIDTPVAENINVKNQIFVDSQDDEKK